MSRVTRGLYRALFRALHACEKEHVPLSTWRDELLSLSPGGGRAPHLEALAPGAMPGASDVQEVRAALRAAFRTPLRGAADEGAALDAALGALRALGLRRKTHVSGVTVATSTSCSRQSHGITCAVKSRFVSPFAGLEPGAPRLPFDELLYEFAYEVTFTNNGTHPVQLATRHWAITTHHDDGTHTTQHVRGAGVVGKHPKLLVGESFKYQSGCVLKAPRGSMQGDFKFVSLTGEDTVRRRHPPCPCVRALTCRARMLRSTSSLATPLRCARRRKQTSKVDVP